MSKKRKDKITCKSQPKITQIFSNVKHKQMDIILYNETKNDSISCPICYKILDCDDKENHVNMCIDINCKPVKRGFSEMTNNNDRSVFIPSKKKQKVDHPPKQRQTYVYCDWYRDRQTWYNQYKMVCALFD